MTVVMLRSLKNGSQLDSAVTMALIAVVVLGCLGMLIGLIAESTITESVRSRVEKELASLGKGTNSKRPVERG
jgi:hypothetical protein